MKPSRSLSNALLLVGLLGPWAIACNSSATDGDGGAGGGATTSVTGSQTSTGGGDAVTADQIAAAADAGTQVTASEEMLVFSDSLFKFDPDLHPDATAASNTSTIKGNAQNQISNCASAKITQAAGLSIDFGSAPGCTMSSGAVVSGTLGIMVSKADATSTLTVNLTFTNLIVNGIGMNGTVAFATTDGSTFSISSALDVTANGKSTSIDGTLSLTGSSGSFSVSGMLTTATGNTTVTNVVLQQGACYASAGSVAIANPALGNPTVTFDSMTPSTGKATLQAETAQGKALPATTITLPAYGTCPHA